VDLARFDAAPLIAFTATKELNYWIETGGRIGPIGRFVHRIPSGRNNQKIYVLVSLNDTNEGTFTATGGRMAVSADTSNSTASAVMIVDQFLPSYYEVQTTFNLDKPTGGWKANGYIIFDYCSDQDSKFAGINVSTNKIEMGFVDESGWNYTVQSNKPVRIKPNTDYEVLIAVNNNNVTLVVEGVNWFTYLMRTNCS
jgi:hypothetical protein